MADEKKIWIKNGSILVNANNLPYYDDHCCCEGDAIEGFADIVQVIDTYADTMKTNHSLLYESAQEGAWGPAYGHGHDTSMWALWDQNVRYYPMLNSTTYLPNKNNRNWVDGLISSSVKNETFPARFRIENEYIYVRLCSNGEEYNYYDAVEYGNTLTIEDDIYPYFYIEERLVNPRFRSMYPFYQIPRYYYTIPITKKGKNIRGMVDFVKEAQHRSDDNVINNIIFSGIFINQGNYVPFPSNVNNIQIELNGSLTQTRMSKIQSIDYSNIGEIQNPPHQTLTSTIAPFIDYTHYHDTSNPENWNKGEVMDSKLWATKNYYVDRVILASNEGYIYDEIQSYIFSSQYYVRYTDDRFIGQERKFSVNGNQQNLIFFATHGRQKKWTAAKYNNEEEWFTTEYDVTQVTCLSSYYSNGKRVFIHTNPLTGYVTNRLYFIEDGDTNSTCLNHFNASYQIAYQSCEYDGGYYKIKLPTATDFVYFSTNCNNNEIDKKLEFEVLIKFDFSNKRYYFEDVLKFQNSLITNPRTQEGNVAYFSTEKQTYYQSLSYEIEDSTSLCTTDGDTNYIYDIEWNSNYSAMLSFKDWDDNQYSDTTPLQTSTRISPWSGQNQTVYYIQFNDKTWFLTMETMDDCIINLGIISNHLSCNYYAPVDYIYADMNLFNLTNVPLTATGSTISMDRVYISPSNLTNGEYEHQSLYFNVLYDSVIERFYFTPSDNPSVNEQCKYFIINYGNEEEYYHNYIFLPNRKYGITINFDTTYNNTKKYENFDYTNLDENQYTYIIHALHDSNNKVTGFNVQQIYRYDNSVVEEFSTATGWFVNMDDCYTPLTNNGDGIWSFQTSENTYYMTGSVQQPPPYYWEDNNYIGDYGFQYGRNYYKIFSSFYFIKNNYCFKIYPRFYDPSYGYIINTVTRKYQNSWGRGDEDEPKYKTFKTKGNIERFKDISPYLCYRTNIYVPNTNFPLDSEDSSVLNQNISTFFQNNITIQTNTTVGGVATTVGTVNRQYRSKDESVQLINVFNKSNARVHTVAFYIDTNSNAYSYDEQYLDPSLKQKAQNYSGVYCQIITGFTYNLSSNMVSEPQMYWERGKSFFATLALSTTYTFSINPYNLNLLESYNLTGFTNTFGSNYTLSSLAKCKSPGTFYLGFMVHVRPIRMVQGSSSEIDSSFVFEVPQLDDFEGYKEFKLGIFAHYTG